MVYLRKMIEKNLHEMPCFYKKIKIISNIMAKIEDYSKINDKKQKAI
jgi:hypothetical protein